MSFGKKKVLNFIKSIYQTFVDLAFGVMSKNSLPTLKCRIFPALSSKACVVPCFILRSTTSSDVTSSIEYERLVTFLWV